MRALWIPLLFVLALPAGAADRTELLPLKYASATEIDRVLQPDSGALRNVVPAGIFAWTVDVRHNALSVTGSEEAIRELQNILRILDVPAVPIRLSVRVLRPGDPAVEGLKGLQPPAEKPGGQAVRAVDVLDGKQAAALEAQPVVSSAEMATCNNSSAVMRWTGQRGQPPVFIRVLPRVNGDGTVTLSVTASGLWAPDGATAVPATVVLRRVAHGQAVVLLPQGSGPALMIRVREVGSPP